MPAAVTEQTVLVPLNDLDALARALEPRDVAIVLTEPALTNNHGLILPDPGYHDALRRLTRDTGTLLAIDETHTQVFGPGGLTAAWGLEPDLVTCGKSIAGGVPFGAWGMTDAIADVLTQVKGPDGERSNLIAIGGTLFGNALSMAAARAAMTEILTPEAYANTQRLGARLADGMRASVAAGRAAVAHPPPRAAGRLHVPARRRSANAAEARACQDDLLTRLIRIWLANRGVWEAIVGAGPVCSVPAARRGRRRLPRGLGRRCWSGSPARSILHAWGVAPPGATMTARRAASSARMLASSVAITVADAASAASSAALAATSAASAAASAAISSADFSLGGGIRMLARMLARAPMIPTPAIITKTPVMRPMRR